ncbi:MAG TPA: energy transducer TonB, partial [Candidatus Kapabacteria bacterium]|nr:energy transducer TonB [Candidatus Kapabacteria bacterium]
QLTLPDMNQPAPAPVSQGTGQVTSLVQSAPVQISVPVEAEPSKDEFFDVSDEPEPVTPIEKLIQYPEVARRSGLEGKVIVQALIAKDGHVEKVDILKSDYDVFKQAAQDAMMKAKFTPARQNGTPLRIWITRTITFKLK